MNRVRLFAVVSSLAVAVLAFSPVGGIRAQASGSVPATAQFRDASGDRIRSDVVSSSYVNGTDCVESTVHADGFYFLRTVTDGCTTTTPRSIVLDFSSCVSSCPSGTECTVADPNDRSGLTLNACASNTVPDVRLIASTLFKSSALTSGTDVSLVFSLQRDVRNTDFELDFEAPVPVSEPSGSTNVRVLTAGNTAIADLFKLVTINHVRIKVLVGKYNMPFELTVTE